MSAPFDLSFFPLFTQAVLYGLYLPTFVYCLRWLIFSDEGLDIRKTINWKMLAITIIFFAFMTVVIGIQFRQTIRQRDLNSLAYDRLDLVTVRVFSDRIYKLMFDW